MENSKAVKRWVPVDIIFSTGDAAGKDQSYSEQHSHLAVSPLVNIEPYMGGISACSAGESLPDDYHEFERSRVYPRPYDAASTERLLRSKLSARGRIFQRSFPFVEQLNQDRLLVNEGLLDACIAKYKGKEWIKVRMPDDVAEQWDARSADQLDEVCKQQNRRQIYTPIMHPAYRNYEYSRRGQSRLDMIRRYLGSDVAGKRLLDIGCNCGYYVFHFRRQGMEVTGIDINREHLAIADAQVAMYGLEVNLRNVAMQDLAVERPFDIVLAMSVFWHILGWGKLPAALSAEELVTKLDGIVGKYLFWESGPEPDREIALIRKNTGLAVFEQLGTTKATGIDNRIFGVFMRTAR